MSNVFPVNSYYREHAFVDEAGYATLYQRSIEDNEGFWREQAAIIDWAKPFTKVKEVSFDKDDLHIRWFEDGELNVCYNCVDRHLVDKRDQPAIIWEGDDPGNDETITYGELHGCVGRFANVLKSLGVTKGDRFTIYMPMIPEAAISMLACARIGAIHSVVFGGFSPDALAGRIVDCESSVVITGDGVRRDEDGYYWITGRVDDVLNVSGHRMGTAEVESALVSHAAVAEAAVVGYPHEIKGQGMYAYVTLMEGVAPSDELAAELRRWVRKEIGPIATPDMLQWAPGLPKTRSGKIMRRILRKIAENDYGTLGDTSTLADPAVVDSLIENRRNR